jgi:hypothetical protein
MTTVLSSTSLRVQWTANGALAYRVERSTISGTAFVVAGSSDVVGAATQFDDSGLTPSTIYVYRVRAFNGGGQATDFGAESSTMTYPVPPGAPRLRGITVASDTIRWYWTQSGGAASWIYLYRSSGNLQAQLSPSATDYLESGLSSATRQSRYLESRNPSGSACSSTVTLATPKLGFFIRGTSTNTIISFDGRQLIVPFSLLADSAAWIMSDEPAALPLTDSAASLVAAAVPPSGMLVASASVTELILVSDLARSTGTLGQLVTVSVPYYDSINPGFVDGVVPPMKVDTLRLCVLNETSGLWEEVPGSVVDTFNKVVRGDIGHLSIFAALGTPNWAEPDLGSVRVYPVPFHPSRSQNEGKPYSAGDPTSGIVFDRLTDSVTIRIYTVTGQLVRSLSSERSGGRLNWDVRNDSGQDVATGGYIAVLTSPGKGKAVKKLLIIR